MKRDELIAAMKAAAGAAPKKLTVEGWGTLYLKPLTVEQVDLQQQEPKPEGKDRLRFARAAARLICDEKGVLVFDSDKTADLELLASQPWDMLQQVLAGGGDDTATTDAGSAAAKKA